MPAAPPEHRLGHDDLTTTMSTQSRIQNPGSKIAHDGWIAAGLAFGCLLLYLRTLCPTVYLGDSGEFCTAIATGGVAHPPGYPIFSLLGRIALALIPVGEPAFRIGCVVALAAALTVGVLYLLARELVCSPWASACGAVVFGLSHSFWGQSTRVEVYSLHALFACLLLLGGLRYRRTGSGRDLALAALAGSLGLAHHLTIVLLGPALLVLCSPRLWKDPGLRRRLLLLGGLLPIGPAFYFLLMLWAHGDPMHNWGRPLTLPLLWNHASARIYRGILGIPTMEELGDGLGTAWRLFSDSFPSALCFLPLLGVGVLWQRDRKVTAGLLLVVIVGCLYNLCYHIDDIAGYYFIVWSTVACLLAVGLDMLRNLARGMGRSPAVAGLVLTTLVGVLLLRNWGACDLSRATWVREFARHKLECVSPRGVLITQGDQDRFPVWYVHDVLGVRPDVIPIDRGFASDAWRDLGRDRSQWYLHRLRHQGVNAPLAIPRDSRESLRLAHDGYLINLLSRTLPDRPICLTFASTGGTPDEDRRVFFRWAQPRFEMLPQGLLLRLQPQSQPVDLPQLLSQNEQLWRRIILPDLGDVRADQDLDPEYVGQHYACMLVNFGSLYEIAGNMARAEAIFRQAMHQFPDYQPAAAALASVRQRVSAGRLSETASQPTERS